jgi:hypothetical protein
MVALIIGAAEKKMMTPAFAGQRVGRRRKGLPAPA